MPVYEYRCEACGKDQEAIQKFSDAPLADCEICGEKGTLKKLISKSSFALKGSGWYTTDYKKSSKPASPENSNGTETVPAAVPATVPTTATQTASVPAPASTPASTHAAPSSPVAKPAKSD